MVEGTVQGLDISFPVSLSPPSPSPATPLTTPTDDDDVNSCEEVRGEREFVAMEATVAVGMREERAAIKSEAEMGLREYSKLDSSGVEGGGDTRGVAVALPEEF